MTEKGGYYFDVIAFRNSDKVRLMDFETRSVYRDVMDEIWVTGFVPNDPVVVSRLILAPAEIVSRVWPAILECLVPMDGSTFKQTSERMEIERKKRNSIRRKRKKFGQLGGKATQAKKRESLQRTECAPDTNQPNASTLLDQNSSQAKAIQVLEQVQVQDIKKDKDPPSASRYSPDFEIFWSAYPRKQAKADAWRSWTKLRPTRALQDAILAAIASQRNSSDWRKEGGDFIPHPATWINQRRWEDSTETLPLQHYRPKGVVL